jgi:hypothetical protein
MIGITQYAQDNQPLKILRATTSKQTTIEPKENHLRKRHKIL